MCPRSLSRIKCVSYFFTLKAAVLRHYSGELELSEGPLLTLGVDLTLEFRLLGSFL
jgi:hypothetical protein